MSCLHHVIDRAPRPVRSSVLGLILAATWACSPEPDSDTSNETTSSVNETAEPWEPWCTEPAEEAAYVDVGTDWGILDTQDGLPERFEHNPVAMADLDGDGDDDLLIALREGGLYFQRNQGDHFEQEWVGAARLTTSIALADVDSDRDLDVVIAGWDSRVRLLLNDGFGGFTDATDGAGLGAVVTEGAVRHAVFGDLNGDGALDLYLTLATPHNDPREGTLDRLLLGDGAGRLEDISDSIDASLRTCLGWASVFVDIDLDGDQDLYTVCSEQSIHGPSRLLRNDGVDSDGQLLLTDLSEDCGCAWTGNPMGASVADFDEDLLPDFYITNTGPSQLLLNLGDETYADAAVALGASTLTDPAAMTYGAAVYDFDNDGWQDILTASGPLHGDQPIASQPAEQPDVLLRGSAEGFKDISAAQGVDDAAAGRGVAVGLLDDDGMLEAVVTHLDAPTRVFRSDCTANRALVVDLVGQAPNTFGVGARVELRLGERTLVRDITANAGWGSSIHPRAHFGLGREPVESLVVQWPSGIRQSVDVGRWVDGRVSVEEPTAE